MKRLFGLVIIFLIATRLFSANAEALELLDSKKLYLLRGEIGEPLTDIQYDFFEDSSWTRISPHGKGPQGLDHLYIKFDDKGNPKGLLIGETKFTNTPAPKNLGNTKDGIQMSDSWINSENRLGDRAKTYADFAEADKLGKVTFKKPPKDATNVMPIDRKGSVYFEYEGSICFWSADEAMKDTKARTRQAEKISEYLKSAVDGKIYYRKEVSWITVEKGNIFQTIYKPKSKVLDDEITRLNDLLRLDTKGSVLYKKPSASASTVEIGENLVYFKENGQTYYYYSDKLLSNRTNRVKSIKDRVRTLELEKNSEDWVEASKTMVSPQRAERIVNSTNVKEKLAKAYGLADSKVLDELSFSEKVRMLGSNPDIQTMRKIASSNENLSIIEARLGKKLNDATASDLTKAFGNIEIDVNTNSRSLLSKVSSFMVDHPYKSGVILVGSIMGINAVRQLRTTGEIDVRGLVDTGVVTTVGYGVGIGMDRWANSLALRGTRKIDDFFDTAKVAKAAKAVDTEDAIGDAVKAANTASDIAGSAAKIALPIFLQATAEVATDVAIYAARMGIEYAHGAEITAGQVLDRLGIAAKYYGIAATASASIGAVVGGVVGGIAGIAGGPASSVTAAGGAVAGGKIGVLFLYTNVGNWWAESHINKEIHEKALKEVKDALASGDYTRLALLAGEEFDIKMASGK